MSFAAAFSVGVLASDLIFGFAGIETTLPLIAFGVLLDTLFVRSVIVPALVMDLGRRVWWPSRLSRAPASRRR